MDIKEIIYTEKGLVNTTFKLIINENKRLVLYNDIEKELNEEEINIFIDKLLRITSSWNSSYYVNSNNLDNSSWLLQMTLSDDKKIKYEGNSYPSNYQTLMNLLGEVVNNELD